MTQYAPWSDHDEPVIEFVIDGTDPAHSRDALVLRRPDGPPTSPDSVSSEWRKVVDALKLLKKRSACTPCDTRTPRS